jgi:hypothetical protein
MHHIIFKIEISKPDDLRSNLFSKLLLVKVVITSAFIGQTGVKRERESPDPEIPILGLLETKVMALTVLE